MAVKNKNGFTLLVAVIFMSVMLSLSLALSSLGYKQAMLASGSIESQYAFYVADAALECVLHADQQLNDFEYASHDGSHPPNATICGGTAAVVNTSGYLYDSSAGLLYMPERFSLDNNTHCADVKIYKYSVRQADKATTRIFSQGYNVPCSTVDAPGSRFASRGISAHY